MFGSWIDEEEGGEEERRGGGGGEEELGRGESEEESREEERRRKGEEGRRERERAGCIRIPASPSATQYVTRICQWGCSRRAKQLSANAAPSGKKRY